MLQLSKSVVNRESVQVNMAYDLIYEAKTQVGLTKPDTLTEKWCFFLYMNDFEATRRFLEALKTAGDS